MLGYLRTICLALRGAMTCRRVSSGRLLALSAANVSRLVHLGAVKKGGRIWPVAAVCGVLGVGASSSDKKDWPALLPLGGFLADPCHVSPLLG